jgi:hypothetical protein
METTTRPQVTVFYGSFSKNSIRVHNNQHAHTLRPSCMICRVHGTAWLREGVPEYK